MTPSPDYDVLAKVVRAREIGAQREALDCTYESDRPDYVARVLESATCVVGYHDLRNALAKARAGEAAVEALERADRQFARLAELAAKPEVQANENGLALSFIFGMERACRDWKDYRKRTQGDQ